MCTAAQLNLIQKKMAMQYHSVYGDDIDRILLYGSYARGDNTEDSDIDIVAIVHGDRAGLQEKLKSLWSYSAEIGLENDVIISPTVIPYDEFEQYKEKLPYYININKEGLLIG